ncbi:radical SAM protein [Demequina litorisediminis]|uniref:Radical SAM protein n=1 Tax=Demequina litorisediminis TaxID=1849022 RepID=A0ABQ6IIT0_9MICO|nr:radical SAM protein [Demequina litorisediminis]
MRWEAQQIRAESANALPGLARISNLVRSVTTPEFAGVTFHEVLAKSALNKVGQSSAVPFTWTINPYRGCSHACVYCFARPSHRYLELDEGADFDSQVIVKVNIVDALRTDLAKRTWTREHVALGTNTDPYQRAEGRYRLMPGIIDALADSGTPFSILTKGSLLRRDLPRLADAARRVPVDLALSIAIFDDEIQQSMEPGTPTATARLATVSAAAEAGFEVAVFMMPVLPFLTDSEEHLDRALARIKEAGATSVTYSALHLRPGVKEWYARWLNTHRPDLTPRYREALWRRLLRAQGIPPVARCAYQAADSRPRTRARRRRPADGIDGFHRRRGAPCGGARCGRGVAAHPLAPRSGASRRGGAQPG